MNKIINENLRFGELIQKLRKDKGWTVREFLDKFDKGISPSYITRIEQYDEIPSPEFIIKIAEIFNCNTEELLECARKIKVKKFDDILHKKYKMALYLYKK
jgi:transcriptional regulator with XRE-family HTH domain